MAVNLYAVSHCDCVITLPGVEKSEGAAIEISLAKYLGKSICPYMVFHRLMYRTNIKHLGPIFRFEGISINRHKEESIS